MVEHQKIAVEPRSRPAMFDAFVDAVLSAGGEIVPVDEASALVWADPLAAADFPGIFAQGTNLEWIQLPYAGIETFSENLAAGYLWTCGKGVYADPVAEHVIALTLAGFRHLHTSIPAMTWPAQEGRNLLGAHVVIVGAGGITESLLRLLEPWNTTVTVVRRREVPVPGATRTVAFAEMHAAIAEADVVVIAAALTDRTRGMVNAEFLDAMPSSAWLVNVARGGHVVTVDLVDALRSGSIAGAALDVTDPEPLPDGHPLFTLFNCIITPHVGNTPEMGLPLITERVRRNVENWIAGEPLIGAVDLEAGY